MNRFNLLRNQNLSKWIGFLIAFLIFGLTIWYSNQFVNQLKKEEQIKAENYAQALQILGSDQSYDSQVQDYLFNITSTNKTMPVILVDENDEIVYVNNIPQTVQSDSLELKKMVAKIKNIREPIVVNLGEFGKQFVYYDNSDLLKRLRYYPIILVLIIIIFVSFSFWYFRILKNTEQSFLWAGMAKETAHQIGTPLSSLLGWIEILKLEEQNKESVSEMEKDIHRLSQITERFSKIGSLPELNISNVVEATENTVNYLKARISKKIDLQFNSPKKEIRIPMNVALYSWVIENLVKNAVDAMQNVGAINVYITDDNENVIIGVEDTGPGIPRKLHKSIFEPGYTTKQRGWGLGLSLAKRIIENYHKGKIFVARSEKGAGTEIRIVLKKMLN